MFLQPGPAQVGFFGVFFGISVMKETALQGHWILLMSVYNFVVPCIPFTTEKICCYPDIKQVIASSEMWKIL